MSRVRTMYHPMDGSARRRRLASVVVGALSMIVIGQLTAGADSVDDEDRFVDLINAERQAVGSVSLVVVPELVAGARAQAEAMAAEGRIFHNQNLGDITDGWYLMGENVGRGGNIETLHDAFMASPGHRDNLLNPVYDAVGVGVVWADGIPYVAEVFMDSIEPVTASFLPPFRDDDASVHQDDIAALFEMGITRGCGSDIYCPDRPVTRAEMASLMVRAFGFTGGAGDVFSDDDVSEHEAAINTLASQGITKGCASGRYCPDRPVTRGEMATFLARALGLGAAGPAGFDDIDASEHAGAIDALAAAGITKGCSATSFCPYDVVTRGQMASFLIRALD
jgi:uncharacterized protein YkwD